MAVHLDEHQVVPEMLLSLHFTGVCLCVCVTVSFYRFQAGLEAKILLPWHSDCSDYMCWLPCVDEFSMLLSLLIASHGYILHLSPTINW